MVRVLSFIKQPRRKEEDMTMKFIKRTSFCYSKTSCHNVVDLVGYLGIEKDFPQQLSSLPYRKKRNLQLSDDHKEYNKSHSKKRIVIEHTICKMKKYRILA